MEESKRAAVVGLAVVALAVAILAGCGGSEKTGDAKRVLRIGLSAGPASLDPTKDGTNVYMAVRALTNESLLHMKPDGSFAPALAIKWRYIGSGNKDFELTLRQNARFSDGTPVTAQAVKGWLDYFNNANAVTASFMGKLESVEAVGKWTVRLHLADSNPVVPAVLSDQNNWAAVSSPKAVANPSILGSRTVGAGPYVLDPAQSVAGDHYTLVPNKHYYDKSAIRFSKVEAKVITTPSSMLQAAKSGQLDVAVGDPTTADAAGSALHVVQGPTNTWILTMYPSGVVSKPLADTRVRQALNYALDRKAIAEAIVGKFGAAASEIPSADGFDAESANLYPYDPAKAKSLLAAAGYPQGFTAEVLVQGVNGNLGMPLVQAMAKYLTAVGVKLKFVNTTSQPQFVQKLTTNKTLPLIQAGLVPSRSMWLQYALYLKEKSIYNSIGSWSDPVIDRAWLEGSKSSDPSPYWTRISQRATQQAYFLPILSNDALYFVSKDVKGVVLTDKRQNPVATEWAFK
ncbi:MAG: peptide/nickel transport system substrate-binding protein [Solirubrobacteraceae bacterium]